MFFKTFEQVWLDNSFVQKLKQKKIFFVSLIFWRKFACDVRWGPNQCEKKEKIFGQKKTNSSILCHTVSKKLNIFKCEEQFDGLGSVHLWGFQKNGPIEHDLLNRVICVRVVKKKVFLVFNYFVAWIPENSNGLSAQDFVPLKGRAPFWHLLHGREWWRWCVVQQGKALRGKSQS